MAASLLAICLLSSPAFAQAEATDPPLDLKLKPPIASTTPTPVLLESPGGTLSVGTIEQSLKLQPDSRLIWVPSSSGGAGGGGTMLLSTPTTPATAPVATPAPGNFKKNLRRCRFLCNFFAPFVNMAAAIKNFFN